MMSSKEQLDRAISEAIVNLSYDFFFGEIVRDAEDFCMLTKYTPGAEMDLGPDAEEIRRKYNSSGDWDTFATLVQIIRLTEPKPVATKI